MTEQTPGQTTGQTDQVDPKYLINGGSHVHVKHAETGAEWDSPVDYLPIARLVGWEPYVPGAPSYADIFDPGVVPATALGEATTVVENGYDPSEHTAEEVNAYLDSLLGNAPGEVARVLEVEAAGKARKTVLEGPHSTPVAPGEQRADTIPTGTPTSAVSGAPDDVSHDG